MRNITLIIASLFAVIAAYALMLASLASAEPPPLTITKSGYYLTEIDSDGVPQLVQLTTIVDLTGGKSPDPPSDKPDIDSALVRQVEKWAVAVDDPQTAQAIAAVYSHVRGAAGDRAVDSTTVWPALKAATDDATSIVGSGKDWTAFRDSLSDVITEGRQRGTLQSVAAIQRMMLSVQHGLELSADGSEALTMDQMTAIAARTNEAIDAQK